LIKKKIEKLKLYNIIFSRDGRPIQMVNREAAPLFLGVSIPIILLLLLIIQLYKFDLVALIKSIDMMYYIVLFPIFLGIILALVNRSK